jgi:integrase
MQIRRKMGEKSLSVQDNYYVFPVGKVYDVQFRDPATRKIQSKISTGKRNKIIARKWAQEEWERCAISGLSDGLFGEYAAPFFTGQNNDPFEIRKRNNEERIGVKTRIDYRADLVNHLLKDSICQIKIAHIRRSDSVALRDRLTTAFGFSHKAKRIWQAYKNIIHTTLESGHIENDSVRRLNISYTKNQRKATSISNVIALLDPKHWENQRLRLAVMTGGIVGFRAGEIRGIKWRDIDVKDSIIRIDREYIDYEGEKKPKREKTRVTIYPEVLKVLLEPLRGNPDDRVFAISNRGPLYKQLRRAMSNDTEKAKIPRITLHGLRHSIQTALRGDGVNPELLRATFGWTGEEVPVSTLSDAKIIVEEYVEHYKQLTKAGFKLVCPLLP